ncbi:VOC family protein [Streptomyces capparidis]
MSTLPEGTPCWADAMFPDLPAAKAFYGEVLGWEYTDTGPDYGHYTQATVGGRNVAGLSPVMEGAPEAPAAWTLYFASADADATAAGIRENGGELLMEPMDVGEFGRMVIARDPAGVVFGVWQGRAHEGFQRVGDPGSYNWAELWVRDAEAADAFYQAVFSFRGEQIGDGEEFDYRVWHLGERMVGAARGRMGPAFPDDAPPHTRLYFGVPDCDDAAATAAKLGAEVLWEPHDSPYGRLSVLRDPQGAVFAVIDPSRSVSEPTA